MESVDACIDNACVELEKLGWTKESIKAIGKFLPLSLRHHLSTLSCLSLA